MGENKIQYTKTTKVDSSGDSYLVRLENERYDVKIRYIGEGFRSGDKVDYDGISAIVRYKGGNLPIKFFIDPKSINRCCLNFNNSYVGYNSIDEMKDVVCEAKDLIQAIMDEIHAEFGMPPALTKEEIRKKKNGIGDYLVYLLNDMGVSRTRTEEAVRNFFAEFCAYDELPPAQTEEEVQEDEKLIQSIIDRLAEKEISPEKTKSDE